VNEVAVLEPSISQTVQSIQTDNEVSNIRDTFVEVNDNLNGNNHEQMNTEVVIKPASDDNISIASQKSSRFESIKSYANILSGGLRKVGSVFNKIKGRATTNKIRKCKTCTHI